MKAERNKNLFLVLIIVISLFISSPVNAFSIKSLKTEEVIKKALGNSIMEQEYPSADAILPTETEKQQKEKKIIQGGITTSIDVTLSDCLRIALGNSSRIKMAMNDILVSHSRIAQTWANYFPTISWTTQYSKIRQLELEDAFSEILVYNYYLLGQISLSQMLYDFGVTQNQVTIKKLGYEQNKETLTETINDVICKTKKAYYNFLLAEQNQKSAQDNLIKYEKFYNQAKAFYEIGLNPKVDVTIAEVNLSKAKLELIHQDNQVDLACAQLNNVMGLPLYNKFNVIGTLQYKPINLSLDDTIEIAKQSRPELKIAELKIEEANQTIKLAKKAYCPTIEAGATYARGGGSWNSNFGYNYGIYLNFDSVNILLNQKKIEEAKALYDKELANAKKIRSDIYLEVQEAYLKLNEKKNQIPVSSLQVKQAKENYELSYGRYKVGVGDAIELKDAQNIYQDSIVNYYNSLYEYNTSKADLEKAIGKNIVSVEEQVEG